MEPRQFSYEEAQGALAKSDPAFGVLFDYFNGRFDILSEGQDDLHKRFDRLDGRVGGIEGHFDELEITVEIIKEDIHEIKQNLKNKADKVISRF